MKKSSLLKEFFKGYFLLVISPISLAMLTIIIGISILIEKNN